MKLDISGKVVFIGSVLDIAPDFLAADIVFSPVRVGFPGEGVDVRRDITGNAWITIF